MADKQFNNSNDQQIYDIINLVYNALKDKGYNPLKQIKSYLLSEDEREITNYNNARRKILELNRKDILSHMLRDYLDV